MDRMEVDCPSTDKVPVILRVDHIGALSGKEPRARSVAPPPGSIARPMLGIAAAAMLVFAVAMGINLASRPPVISLTSTPPISHVGSSPSDETTQESSSVAGPRAERGHKDESSSVHQAAYEVPANQERRVVRESDANSAKRLPPRLTRIEGVYAGSRENSR